MSRSVAMHVMQHELCICHVPPSILLLVCHAVAVRVLDCPQSLLLRPFLWADHSGGRRKAKLRTAKLRLMMTLWEIVSPFSDSLVHSFACRPRERRPYGSLLLLLLVLLVLVLYALWWLVLPASAWPLLWEDLLAKCPRLREGSLRPLVPPRQFCCLCSLKRLCQPLMLLLLLRPAFLLLF